MDARERHAIECDSDNEPRLYRFTPRPWARTTDPPIRWTDGDICTCGEKCAKHWNAWGDWIGCLGAKNGGAA